MQNKKTTLIVIIVLLILFVPLAVVSTTLHFKMKGTKDNVNPNHEFQYEGQLYFYNQNELIGTYTCQNTDYCDYAILSSNYKYSLDEYQPEKLNKVSLIHNRYAFLMDTTTDSLANVEIILYDVKLQKEISRFKEVKNYGIGISHDNYIVQNKDGLWGVIQFYDGVNLKIPFTYDYIGLVGQKEEETKLIASDTFAVFKDNVWYLIDINNNKLTDSFIENIYTYNNDYVVTTNGNSMKLLTYNSRNRLFGDYKYINFCSKYIALIDNSNTFFLFDLQANKEVSNHHIVTNPKNLKLEKINNIIQIYVDEKLVETVAIQ